MAKMKNKCSWSNRRLSGRGLPGEWVVLLIFHGQYNRNFGHADLQSWSWRKCRISWSRSWFAKNPGCHNRSLHGIFLTIPVTVGRRRPYIFIRRISVVFSMPPSGCRRVFPPTGFFIYLLVTLLALLGGLYNLMVHIVLWHLK